MFDRCRVWRRRLTRRADGTLPMSHWGALEHHLARCSRCRAAYEADCALHEVLGIHSGLPTDADTRAFDDRVVARVRSTCPASVATHPVPASAFAQARFGFLTQVVGGGLVAASITALCLSSALRPPLSLKADRESGAEKAAFSTHRNEPPVPLESLLQSAQPRAAWLWTPPSPSHHHLAPAPRPAEFAPIRPVNAVPASAKSAIPTSLNPQETLANALTMG